MNIRDQALRFGVAFVEELDDFPCIRDRVQWIAYTFAKQHGVIPLEKIGTKVRVAFADPLQTSVIEELQVLLGCPVEEVWTWPQEIERAIERCYHQKDNVASELIATLLSDEVVVEQEEGYDLLDASDEATAIRLLNVVITEAIQQSASDIHFEPKEQGLSIRYRIDGVLQTRHSPPPSFQSPLITRIKVMASLDIAEHRMPQDGRIKLKLGGRQIDFRVSTIPVVYGERIVLRILDRSNLVLGLEGLGMQSDTLTLFRQLIHMSEGLILVTGPTGSGKTTTLYSALAHLNSSAVNIMTIEDPVEYKMQGMAQIGVSAKLSFAVGLRHILRQDPDIVMIGEIRDAETLQIAVQAAMTGHLVFATVHTNDAMSTFIRLHDLGVIPSLLSSSINGVLAQRLLRLNCPACMAAYCPCDQELGDMDIQRSELKDGVLYRGLGCPACHGTGFQGRRGIYELVRVSSSIKVALQTHIDAGTLTAIARQEGVRSLRQDGAFLVLQGITCSSEVLRVTRSGE